MHRGLNKQRYKVFRVLEVDEKGNLYFYRTSILCKSEIIKRLTNGTYTTIDSTTPGKSSCTFIFWSERMWSERGYRVQHKLIWNNRSVNIRLAGSKHIGFVDWFRDYLVSEIGCDWRRKNRFCVLRIVQEHMKNALKHDKTEIYNPSNVLQSLKVHG